MAYMKGALLVMAGGIVAWTSLPIKDQFMLLIAMLMIAVGMQD